MEKKQSSELLYLKFNQNSTCFACGTSKGFSIYSANPFQQAIKREFTGGIGIVEMIYRCNVFALVGRGKSPRYPQNKVMLWDDYQQRNIGELCFRSEVKGVRLRRDRVVVVLENKIHIYNFQELKLLDTQDTGLNPQGLCCLSTSRDKIILAYPDANQGFVSITDCINQKTKSIRAHSYAIFAIALNTDGSKLASSSQNGRIIRIFDVQKSECLQVLRRGISKAEIWSLTFDPNSKWIACSSDEGIIHIFNVKQQENSEKQNQLQPSNPKSKFSFLGGWFPYFSQEWSFSQFKIPDMHHIVCFGTELNSIIVISVEGSYYLAHFNPEIGGDCELKSYKNILSNEWIQYAND